MSSPTGSPVPHDRLAAVQADLAALDGLALVDHAEVFERIHSTLVDVLNSTVERPNSDGAASAPGASAPAASSTRPSSASPAEPSLAGSPPSSSSIRSADGDH